jgi:sugar phosphate isomerase/epimerase
MDERVCVSFLTLSGRPYDRPPKWDMHTRAMAANDAGITAIGVSLTERVNTDALKWADVPEAEWVEIHQPIPPGTWRQIARFRDELGVTQVNVGVCGLGELDEYVILSQLTKIADMGLTAAFEPVAFGYVSQVYSVLDYTRQLGRPDVGLLFDMWQVYRDDPSFRLFSRPLVGDIVSVQVCGVPRRCEDVFKSSQNRPLLTQSDTDGVAWLCDLRTMGYRGPVSYECPHRTRKHEVLSEVVSVAAADMRLLNPIAVSAS